MTVHAMDPRLERTWGLADDLFHQRLVGSALNERPIELRNPFLFYAGHLPSFAWNKTKEAIGLQAFNEEFDILFERGIDPDVDDPTKCHRHSAAPPTWPSTAELCEYRDRVRKELRHGSRLAKLKKTGVLEMVIEHDQMHLETLMYMVLQLDPRFIVQRCEQMERARPFLRCRLESRPTGASNQVAIPAGSATLGREHGTRTELWGWDNEFGRLDVQVEAFEVDPFPVTVGEYMEFVRSGAYLDAAFWDKEGWLWRERERFDHPRCLRASTPIDGSNRRPADDDWSYVTVNGPLSIEEVRDVPVYVSLFEARAYASWRGKRLPTEAEWDRMAYGKNGAAATTRSMYPWGDDAPVPGVHGNFGYFMEMPAAVDRFPKGASPFGVQDLVGNGWELTETPFGPLPGFEPDPYYTEYSTDFFEGRHYVVKGASWATDTQLIRPTFRNWYQANYPYVFAKFRLVSI